MKKPPEYIIILQMCTTNNNHMMHFSWDMKRDAQKFLSFWTISDHFLPFCPFFAPNNPKNQSFAKMKKNRGDIILQKCTINYNQMIFICYAVPWIVCNGCNCYFSFWVIFCPFTSKNQNLQKNWKDCMDISSFYNSVPKIMIICYTVPEIWCMTDVIIFHFRPCFALLPS